MSLNRITRRHIEAMPRISAPAAKVLCYLLFKTNSLGLVVTTGNEISDAIGMPVRCVCRALASLRAAHVITTHSTGRSTVVRTYFKPGTPL